MPKQHVTTYDELVLALKELAESVDLSKLKIREDFHKINVHACALKALHFAKPRKERIK
jgi:hypothetical protein